MKHQLIVAFAILTVTTSSALGTAPTALAENSTSISAQAAIPADPMPTRVVPGRATREDVLNFLGQYTVATYAEWDKTCPERTICGTTDIGPGAPVIHLSPRLLDDYLSRNGQYVLVHEAAHARSRYLYGSFEQLVFVSEKLTGLKGAAAAEYMADCATIAKIGWSGGTYTKACTRAQLIEGARYWGAVPVTIQSSGVPAPFIKPKRAMMIPSEPAEHDHRVGPDPRATADSRSDAAPASATRSTTASAATPATAPDATPKPAATSVVEPASFQSAEGASSDVTEPSTPLMNRDESSVDSSLASWIASLIATARSTSGL